MLKLERDRLLASTMISGFAASLLMAGSAFAQDTAPAAPDAAAATAAAEEEVVVTGTRIQKPGVISTSPITTIGADELELKQTPEIERVIRDLPAVVPGDGANVNNGTAGAATVDLRGLGENRTLVLLDGKRMTPYDENGFVDVSVIPVAMLERVDIVTGGASAVYGSDAVAGAVNFILKKNFEGVAVDTEYSMTGRGDGGTFSTTGVIGANVDDGRGNVTMALSYTNRQPVQLSARTYGLVEVTSANGSGLSGAPPAPDPNCTSENTFFNDGTVTSSTLLTVLTVRGGATPLQVRNDGTLGARCNTFNFNPYNYYQTGGERYSFLATGEYDINENVTAYARTVFQNTYVRQQIAPSGLFNNVLTIPLANPFLSASARQTLIDTYTAAIAAVPGRTIDTPALGITDGNGNGIVDAADSITLGVRRRTPELGERSSTFETNLYQVMFGVKGDISENWSYDLSYQHGRSKKSEVRAGYTNVANIEVAANSISATTCTTPGGETTDGCVPINLFGPQGSITPEQASYASATAILDKVYTQDVVSGFVSGSLPGITSPFATDPLSVAFGAEYRQEKGSTTPDECLKLPPVSCLGGAGGNLLPISAKFDVYEFYAEAIMPLVQDQPGFESLTLEIGGRYSEYTPGGQNTTYKVGLDWEPVGGLRFRGMFQRAVRAPNIGELGSPVTTGLSNAQFDYCSVGNPNPIGQSLRDLCISTGVDPSQFIANGNGTFTSVVTDIAAGQVNVFVGTNLAALPTPEEAETLTLGVVFQPDFMGDAIINPIVTVDYYDIQIDGPIGLVSGQEVLDGCYVANIQSFCDGVVRLDGGLDLPGSGLETFTQNLVSQQAEGIEVTFSFGLDLDTIFGTQEAGELNFAFIGNMYLTNEYKNGPTSEVVDCLGHYGNACPDVSHEYRWVMRSTYATGDWQFSALWRHLGETTVQPNEAEGLFEDFRRIGAYDYLDLIVSYQLYEEVGLSLGATNVFDRDPPIIGNTTAGTDINSGNTFPSNFDPLGTVYSLGVNLRF